MNIGLGIFVFRFFSSLFLIVLTNCVLVLRIFSAPECRIFYAVRSISEIFINNTHGLVKSLKISAKFIIFLFCFTVFLVFFSCIYILVLFFCFRDYKNLSLFIFITIITKKFVQMLLYFELFPTVYVKCKLPHKRRRKETIVIIKNLNSY